MESPPITAEKRKALNWPGNEKRERERERARERETERGGGGGGGCLFRA